MLSSHLEIFASHWIGSFPQVGVNTKSRWNQYLVSLLSFRPSASPPWVASHLAMVPCCPMSDTQLWGVQWMGCGSLWLWNCLLKNFLGYCCNYSIIQYSSTPLLKAIKKNTLLLVELPQGKKQSGNMEAMKPVEKEIKLVKKSSIYIVYCWKNGKTWILKKIDPGLLGGQSFPFGTIESQPTLLTSAAIGAPTSLKVWRRTDVSRANRPYTGNTHLDLQSKEPKYKHHHAKSLMM